MQDEYGRTALHASAEEGLSYYASILIERGADIHRADKEGDTPLDYAVFHEHGEIADLLRSRGANRREGKSAKQKREDTVYEGFTSIDAARRLIDLIEDKKEEQDGRRNGYPRGGDDAV